MTRPTVAEGFPTVTLEDWTAAVVADLGADGAVRRLRFTSEDGVTMDALRTEAGPGAGVGEVAARLTSRARADSPFPHALGVRQRVDASEMTVAQVREAVAGGSDSVELDFAHVDPTAVEAKVHSLSGPVTEAGCELAFRSIPPSAWEAVLPSVLRQGSPVSAGVDVLAPRPGGARMPNSALDALARLAAYADGDGRSRLLRASGVPWFEAGATVGCELALAVAAGLEYVMAFEQFGVDRAAAARQVELELALGTELFEGIAAVRAARLVWARALEVAGADSTAPLRLAVTCGTRLLSRRDPWTNSLRNTAVAFAAAIGGADVVRLPAFDERSGASPAAWRLARNTPLILREEAGLGRVADPAGGSWYLDAATGLLAERVWAMLAEIDAAGGLRVAMAEGLVQHRIETQRAAREAAIRRRERPIIGVSEFPDRTVRTHGVAAAGATVPRAADSLGDAEPFERLQGAADSFAATHRGRARLLVVRLGPAAESGPRAAFARGIAEVGGMEPVPAPDTSSAEAVAAALVDAGAKAAVLCGTDARYSTEAGPLAAALKQAGARCVLIAGRPAVDADGLRAAGIDDFVYAGADIAAVAERLLRAAGVLP